MMRIARKGRLRFLLVGVLLVAIVLIGVYHGMSDDTRSSIYPLASSGDNDPVDAEPAGPNAIDSASQSSIFNRFSWGVKKQTEPVAEVCQNVPSLAHVDVNTGEQYPSLDFSPQYKMYWNATFETRYLAQKNSWQKHPLKVFIMPHSHNDPGWLQTFDNYFFTSTSHILDNMVKELSKYNELKFIWSEISFFAKWWDSLQNRLALRDAVKRLVREGNLEIVSGGWVMTDEAGAHYYSMLDQLIEGHQWLRSNLGLTEVPTNGWSVDPFGHSSSWAYILRKAGISNTVIQRTHFAWKQVLAERKELEFWWRQSFDAVPLQKDKELFCLMAPFDLYSIKHTCGPDTDVCRQFDFRRIPGEYSESRSVPITKENVAEKAHLILGQYGRTASLFPHNVALIPLGDDFRFGIDKEWKQQRENYNLLMEYINTNKEEFNNTEIKFGSLKDYFDEVHARRARMTQNETEAQNTLLGDFFPYGDIYADSKPSYWTGYFTTRPFYKALARELEHWLRSTEILYSLARAHGKAAGDLKVTTRLLKDYRYVSEARQNLGLFQHHDAITGTAKELVMEDYGKKMHRSIQDCIGVISHCVQFLTLLQPVLRQADVDIANPMTSYLFSDSQRPNWDESTKKTVIEITPPGVRKVIAFNSHGHERVEPIRIHVSSPIVRVIDNASGNEVPIQVNPVWNSSLAISSYEFEVLFIPRLPALSLTAFTIESLDSKKSLDNNAVISVYLNDAQAPSAVGDARRKIFTFDNPSDKDFELSSPSFTAIFDKRTALLKSISLRGQDKARETRLMFQAYKSTQFYSGAYLFSFSQFEPMQNVTQRFPIVKLVQGKLSSELIVEYSRVIEIVYKVYHSDAALGAGLELQVRCDASNKPELMDWELVMRLQTDIVNVDKALRRTFYTDSNGFQILKRNYATRVGAEANYYPMTSSFFIEDKSARLTLLSSHSHGVTSPQNGEMEVMLERKIRYDDNRGLGEGILDNRPFTSKFWIILESVVDDNQESATIPNLSLLSHFISNSMLYPPVVTVSSGFEDRPMRPQMVFLNSSFPCDLHLVNLRSLPESTDYGTPSRSSLLTVHNKGRSCRTTTVDSTEFASCAHSNLASTAIDQRAPFGQGVTVPTNFANVEIESIAESTLTGMKNVGDDGDDKSRFVPHMELASFNVTFA